ncbi:MAG: hypothetical protein AAFU57_01575 [Bacteroidota bacterium]
MRKFKSNKVNTSKYNSKFGAIRRLFLLSITVFGMLLIVLINLSAKLNQKTVEEYNIISSVLNHTLSGYSKFEVGIFTKEFPHKTDLFIDNKSELDHLERAELNWYILKNFDNSFSRADLLVNRKWELSRIKKSKNYPFIDINKTSNEPIGVKFSNVIFNREGNQALVYVRVSKAKYPKLVYRLIKNKSWEILSEEELNIEIKAINPQPHKELKKITL